MASKGFPTVVTQGQQCNIGEKSTVILYTYINHHVGTPKQKERNNMSLELDVKYILNKSSRLQ